MLTERRTPTATNIAFAGENTCCLYIRADLGQDHSWRLTRPTLSPRPSERVEMTLTVGSSHLVHRSS